MNIRKSNTWRRKIKLASSESFILLLIFFWLLSQTQVTRTLHHEMNPLDLNLNESSIHNNQMEKSNEYLSSYPNLHDVETCQSGNFDKVEQIDEKFMFWWDGQEKLCHLIREMKGEVSSIHSHGSRSMLNLLVNCTDLTHNNGLGTGNWMVGFFMVHILAAYSSVYLNFTCSVANMKTEILPFLQGCHSPVTDSYPSMFDKWLNRTIAEDFLCSSDMRIAPVHLAAFEIKKSMRQLILQTTGFDRPPLSVLVQTKMFGDVTFDEVAIHFRCGDVLHTKNPRGDYGFTRYSEYRKRIPLDVKTIGIITQSFNKSENREQDRPQTENCQELVTLILKKLQSDYPFSRISIRNGPLESLPLVYVRLAVAEYSIIGLSSFSAFPLLANYGFNYFEEGRLLVNKWMNNIPKIMTNAIAIKGEFLRNKHIMKKGLNFTKHWILG
jgi:hypothetical protein